MVTQIAIVDYGLGNLFSVKHACEHVGLQASVTASRAEILGASAVLLPGVGAFGDAMATLHRLDLVSVLRDVAASGKPLLGVCLGIQLLMTESYEFGRHKGLGIIDGEVVPFDEPEENGRVLKVPQIGWNNIRATGSWANSMLSGVKDGSYMYFVHSYVAKPDNRGLILSTSTYGDFEFCSSLKQDNIMACQFHPERSGKDGLHVYRNLAIQLTMQREDAINE